MSDDLPPIRNKLIFYNAPGHAWLRVPMKDIRTLGLDQGAISPFSYIKHGYAYLECDQDYETYLAARKAQGYEDPDITDRMVKSFNRNSPTFSRKLRDRFLEAQS